LRIVNLFQEAQRYIPGGVNSPVRAFRSVGGEPVFIRKASGAYFWGEDGERYTDYVGSWGPMILGHAHPDVIEAVRAAALDGLSFGAPTAIETELAKRVCTIMPSIELVRFVSSGTEATMSAIRLARGFTGRDKIVKFEGCYHGHSDSLLVKAGSGALTLGVPTSPGVPASLAQHTITLTYNDLDEVEQAFAEVGDEIACIIVEPIAGNMNMVLPAPGFLEGLRAVCDRHGALLIFDEVMTGFRVALGGVQEISGVTPDLTTLGKIIGGGMPVGAFGGKRKDHGIHRSARPRVPGRHAVRQSGRDARRHRHAGPAEPGALRGAGRAHPAAGRGRAGGGRRRGHPVFRPLGRRHVRPVLHGRRTGAQFQAGHGLRPGALQGLLPRHAGGKGLSRTIGLRGRLRLAGAHRRGRRRHRGGRRAGDG
jgi:hypothetical protein